MTAIARGALWIFFSLIGVQGKNAPWTDFTRPLVIGHRGGACAYAPEHSIASYLSGIAHGVDMSECDVCWSKELVPICRHEPFLSQTTDALVKFPNMIRSKILDGSNITDVWAEDLTLAQLKSLRLYQKVVAPTVNRTHQYDGIFQIMTLEEHIQLVLAANRTVGIIPELKHSTYFNGLKIFKKAKTTNMQQLLRVLDKYGFKGPANSPEWRQRPVWIQSFEQNDLVYVAHHSCIPLVQLVDGPGTRTADRNKTFESMVSDSSLDGIASYATVFGPWKDTLALVPASTPNAAPVDSGLVARAQDRGMVVTPYTFRPEATEMAPYFRGVYFDEYRYFLRNLSIDGVWADAGDTMTNYLSMESILGQGWRADMRTRLNHMPVPCKMPSGNERKLSSSQYPQLYGS